MNQEEYLHLVGERNALTRMIKEIPKENIIDLGSLKARLEDIEYKITMEKSEGRKLAKVRLTFNGKPVIGSYGIFAEFAMKAVNSFTDAITTMAASFDTPLASMGPIPKREQYQLLITNTALGSFGFELEESPSEQFIFDQESPVALALERTQNILEGTIGSDDMLADSIAEINPRVREKIRIFLSTLADNDSVCAMQFKEHFFRFTDVGQVKTSVARIAQDNVYEAEENLNGMFEGILPISRQFEFRIQGEEEVIRGKIDKSIANIEEINTHLHLPTDIKVMVTKVNKGKPRFVMLEMPTWIN